jgi:hypothetical protein
MIPEDGVLGESGDTDAVEVLRISWRPKDAHGTCTVVGAIVENGETMALELGVEAIRPDEASSCFRHLLPWSHQSEKATEAAVVRKVAHALAAGCPQEFHKAKAATAMERHLKNDVVWREVPQNIPQTQSCGTELHGTLSHTHTFTHLEP